MQEQERVHSEKHKELLEEVNKLRNEKEQQQKLLTQSLLLPEDARVEASLKHEITRLTSENLVGHSAFTVHSNWSYCHNAALLFCLLKVALTLT